MKRKLNCILLVDDCEADNYLHKRVIRAMGIFSQVITKRHVEEALTFIEENKQKKRPQPELIFLDINTPGREGWDFLVEYAQIKESTQDSVIIMLSGSLNPEDKERADAEPLISDYLTKPLTRESVTTITNNYFL